MQPKNVKFDVEKQELIKPALRGLPVSYFVSTFSPDTYGYVNWHWHNAFQYSLVTKGRVDFLLSGHIYTVSSGNGIFLNYRQIHLIKAHDEKEVSSYICIDVPPSFIAENEHSRIFLRYLKPMMENPTPAAVTFYSRDPDDLEVLDRLRDISDLLKGDQELLELDVKIKTMEIWKWTWKKIKKEPPAAREYSSYDAERLRTIFTYMADHYGEKILLEDIASQISVSRAECCRFFKKQTGQSLFDYLTSYRINKSLDLLSSTDMSIAEIAASVGFCNQSYYTNRFRSEKKITPKQFRELSIRSTEFQVNLDIHC